MGQCVKCGRETKHVYAYYECEKIVFDGIVSYENMEKRSDFICSRCVLVRSMAITLLIFLVYLGIAVGAVLWGAMWLWWLWAIAVGYLGLWLYFFIRLLLDKRLPFKANADNAVEQILKIRQGQNPKKLYFTYLYEYEKLTGGITP